MTYQDMKTAVKQEIKNGGPAKAATRGTILGRLFALKEQLWREQLETCPLRGEALPNSVADFLAWSKTLRAVDVRVALGISRARARALHAGLRVAELAAYYALVLDEELPF